jgi:starch phosphorylase
MAWFSSDRTIREYAEDIWDVPVAGEPPSALALPHLRKVP